MGHRPPLDSGVPHFRGIARPLRGVWCPLLARNPPPPPRRQNPDASAGWMTVKTGKSPKLPGSRPAGTSTEGEASARVREMFSRIAPRYDFLNHALSFSL